MAEIKKSDAIKSIFLHTPNISIYEHNVTMSMIVTSMRPYCGASFTFDSLMTQLSEETRPQHVLDISIFNNITSKGNYAASQMVEIARKYYDNGYKVIINLRSLSDYNWTIDFQKMSVPAGAASAASPFRSKKSQRSRSKSAKKRRNLKNKSKSKSKKRSPKPRRR
jgi:hypothetical protein